MPADFLVIRHGQSLWNASGRWQGQGDPPLSERGREQARSVARELVAQAPSRLVASDLARARETAEILAAELGLEVELDPGFRELDVGVWSGLTAAEVTRGWPDELRRFRAGDGELRAGGGESWSELEARALEAFERWAGQATGCVAVVTHGGLLRRMLGLEFANTQWERVGLHDLRGAGGRV